MTAKKRAAKKKVAKKRRSRIVTVDSIMGMKTMNELLANVTTQGDLILRNNVCKVEVMSYDTGRFALLMEMDGRATATEDLYLDRAHAMLGALTQLSKLTIRWNQRHKGWV